MSGVLADRQQQPMPALSADQIRGVLAGRSNANNNTAESPTDGVTHINAGPLQAQIKRLSSDPLTGRWRMRVRITHRHRPQRILFEEIRLGERDFHDGGKDHKLVRHGWWLLDNLADAARCSNYEWAQPHPGLGLIVDDVDQVRRTADVWDAARLMRDDLIAHHDLISRHADRYRPRYSYSSLGRPRVNVPADPDPDADPGPDPR